MISLSAKSPFEILEELIQKKIKADQYQQEIEIQLKFIDGEYESLKSIIRESNKLCMDINALLIHIK